LLLGSRVRVTTRVIGLVDESIGDGVSVDAASAGQLVAIDVQLFERIRRGET
jgi:hypothetical protein